MDAEEKTLSKKEIDEYIRLNYKSHDNSSSSFFTAIGVPMVFLPGKRYATTPTDGGGLQYLLDKIRSKIELTFSEKLMELIKEKGKKPAEIYKKANVDKATFSKIKGDKNYHPTKDTALAFSIALHLNLDETEDLIGRAGYKLSDSIKRDLIVKCYIETKTYNIHDLNIKLSDYNLDPLTNKRSS